MPGGEEVVPLGEIRSRCPAKGDVVVELACCSGEVYEPAEEDAAWCYHFAGKCQLAFE